MSPSAAPSRPYTQSIMSVTGLIPCERMGVCDAHNHVWIEGFAGSDPANPVLDQFDHIRDELADYKKAGGSAILDCQPGGCGRNGLRLRDLSEASGVNIVACTGFHRRKYFPPNAALWKMSSHSAADLFIKELTSSLEESADDAHPIKAGFIKISLEGRWEDCPLPYLEAAAEAASKTGCLIEIHTEKGALASEIVEYFSGRGVSAGRLVICHIDKRPDFGLHAELAAAGALLEYDTFFRAKYEPETRLWPLIDCMVAAGLGESVALATDMAEKEMYRSIGGGPGLASLPRTITPRLRERGIPEADITWLTGGNIARRLARPNLM